MARLAPIRWKKFEKFLHYVGCEFVRSKGAHRIYNRSDLNRPIVITISKKGMLYPVHIVSNLHTLKIEVDEYLKIIEII